MTETRSSAATIVRPQGQRKRSSLWNSWRHLSRSHTLDARGGNRRRATRCGVPQFMLRGERPIASFCHVTCRRAAAEQLACAEPLSHVRRFVRLNGGWSWGRLKCDRGIRPFDCVTTFLPTGNSRDEIICTAKHVRCIDDVPNAGDDLRSRQRNRWICSGRACLC